MKFCTQCGMQIEEGQPHNCPAAKNNNPVQQTVNNPAPQNIGGNVQAGAFNPYANNNGQANNVNPNTNQNPQNCNVNPNINNNPQNGNFNSGANNQTIQINKDAVKDAGQKVLNTFNAASNNTKAERIAFQEKGKKIVPDIIDANDGEIPIKQYNVARLRNRLTFAKADGRIQVTNKRVLFRAAGPSIMGKTTLHQEFKIDEIAGIELRNTPVFNIFTFFFGLLITSLFGSIGYGIAIAALEDGNGDVLGVISIICAVLFVLAWIALTIYFRAINSLKKYHAVRLAALALPGGTMACLGAHAFWGDIDPEVYIGFFVPVAICALISLFLIAFTPNLTIKVKTKGSFPGINITRDMPVALLSFLFGGAQTENSGFTEIAPWTDTDLANKELGTLIDDIQTLGDAAIKKWKQD